MSIAYFGEGDTLSLAITLTGKDGTAQSLAGATSVTLSVWPQDSDTPVIDAASVTVADASAGEVTYEDTTGLVTGAKGRYRARVVAALGNGDVVSFPSDRYDTIVVT